MLPSRESVGPVLCCRCGRVDKGYRESERAPWLCGECENLRLALHGAIAGLLMLAVLVLYGVLLWLALGGECSPGCCSAP